MNEHIAIITPNGMDCQCTAILFPTNLMLLGTARRKQALYVVAVNLNI